MKRPLILLPLLALAAEPAISQTIDASDALYYYEGGAPWARVEYMTLSFPERRITIDCYRNGDDFRKKQNATKRRDHVCTEAEWRDIVGWLGAARFNEWDEVYAPGAFDGTVWRLEFLSGTNVVCCFLGHNKWPKRFYEFQKVKDFAMKLPEEPHAETAKFESHAEFVEAEEEPLALPDPSAVASYTRVSFADMETPVPVQKAEGNALLERLSGWRSFPPPSKRVRDPLGNTICVRQSPWPEFVLTIIGTDASTNLLSFVRGTKHWKTGAPFVHATLETSDGRSDTRSIPEPARAELERQLGAWDASDRAAFLAVPLPRTYVFGTTSWDGGTLSGVAKLFYGNGNKWRVIWEANKAAVPNPDYVRSGTPLVIPALSPAP